MKNIPRVSSKRPKVGTTHNLGSPPIGRNHPDALAVDRFAVKMRVKLARKRAEGRGGWENREECSAEFLSQLLREHVDKGDPIDVANFCMMLHQRGERISPSPETDVEPVAWQWRHPRATGGEWYHAPDGPRPFADRRTEAEYRPLYAHPPAPQTNVAPGSFGIEDSRIAYQHVHAVQDNLSGWTPPPESDRIEGFECLAFIPVRWQRSFARPQTFEWGVIDYYLTIEGSAKGWAPLPPSAPPQANQDVTPPDASAPTHQVEARLAAQRPPAGGTTSTLASPQTEYPQGGRPADIGHERHVHERAFVDLPSDASINGALDDSTAPAPGHHVTVTLSADTKGVCDLLAAAQSRIDSLAGALQRISRWHGEFPETGQFWDEEKTRPMSYGAAFGSNGQRDFMRSVAKEALEAFSAPSTNVDDSRDELFQLLKDARQTIALLTPFPVEGADKDLNDAINQAADKADAMRKRVAAAICAYPTSQTHLEGLLQPQSGAERNVSEDGTIFSGDFEALPVYHVGGKNLLREYLPSGKNGLIVGVVESGELRSFRISIEGGVAANMKVIPGHFVSSEVDDPNPKGNHQFPPTAEKSTEGRS